MGIIETTSALPTIQVVTIDTNVTTGAPDPFDGQGDFNHHPLERELATMREAERVWRERALRAELSLMLVAAWLPTKKVSKADLEKTVRMIRREVEERLEWRR